MDLESRKPIILLLSYEIIKFFLIKETNEGENYLFGRLSSIKFWLGLFTPSPTHARTHTHTNNNDHHVISLKVMTFLDAATSSSNSHDAIHHFLTSIFVRILTEKSRVYRTVYMLRLILSISFTHTRCLTGA